MSGTTGIVPRYAVILNNLKQRELVDFRIVDLSDGPRHNENWTATIIFEYVYRVVGGQKMALAPRPEGYTATASSKREARTIASYYALLDLGYI
ncbi:hypothetical protein FRB95_002029 [Tulasnella sp. JGI-2019a]|nr:hypothetical protein FRB95_002029 [Tulasnella sp. JGI-2019a]